MSEHRSSAPSLLDLQRVIPVGQARTHGDVTVELLSLELYADGFVVNGRVLVGASTRDEASGNAFLMLDAQSRAHVDDDLGRAYVPTRLRGDGGRQEYRFGQAFSPSLPEGAKTLRIELANIRRARFDPLAPDDRSRDVRLEGPWVFQVPLDATPAIPPRR
jgi:hypothetical protein